MITTKKDDDVAKVALVSAPAKETDFPSNIPRVEDQKNAPSEPVRVMPKLEDYKGHYLNREDGEIYALCVTPGENRTSHKAMNDRHFWEGSEEDFRGRFDKQ